MAQTSPCSGQTVHCADLAQTRALAAALAGQLRPGDVVLLDGALAAGKTTFVAALCARLGTARPASSPTYAISHIYPADGFDVIHVDAYRLQDAAGFHDLALEEFLPEAITLIEWGERVVGAFDTYLQVTIGFGPQESARVIDLNGSGARWQPVLARLGDG